MQVGGGGGGELIVHQVKSRSGGGGGGGKALYLRQGTATHYPPPPPPNPRPLSVVLTQSCACFPMHHEKAPKAGLVQVKIISEKQSMIV